MKRLLLLFLAISMGLNPLLAQKNKTFKISYNLHVDESIKNIDPDTETDPAKKELATTALFVSMFQDGTKPVARAWVNNEFIRVSTELIGNSVQITNKKTDESFILDPENKQYSETISATDKIIASEDEIMTADELPMKFITGQEKIIAGFKCKLAQMTYSPSEGKDVSIDIWYCEQIPSLYWGEYAYLNKVPGAALQVGTMGIGIIATEVKEEKTNQSLFEIPKDYTLIENTLDFETVDFENLEENYEIGENRFIYTDTTTGLFGIIDSLDNILVEPIYSSIGSFYEGQSIVTNDEYIYGTIDMNGKQVLPFKYESLIYDENSKMFNFTLDGLNGLMDLNEKIIIPNKYESLSFFNHGYALFYANENVGIIDSKGTEIIPATHLNITDYTKTHFITNEADEKSYIYSIANNKKTSEGFDYLTTTEETNIFLAMKNNAYGFIDAQGKTIIPFKYIYASPFSNGVSSVLVNEDEDYQLINIKGETVEIEE